MAMLKALAPKARMPPSPKKRAWTARATEMARTAGHGPRTTAASTAPVAWPVVPPGRGTLNIMMTKEAAAKRATRGIRRRAMTERSRERARTQKGTDAAIVTMQVEGLR